MDLGLNDRVALVTGASQGIGLGIAGELAAEGARVAISSRTKERVEAAASEIGARPYVHDMLDLDAAPGLVRSVEEDLGPIEILVTNTGGPPGGDPLGFTREQWEQAHRELVVAPIELIELVVPGMRERGFGRVLNVASSTVLEPNPKLMLSNSHRPGIVAAFKTLARAFAGDGITFNSLLPGGSRPSGWLTSTTRSTRPTRRRATRSPPGGSAPPRRWERRPPSSARSAPRTSRAWPSWWTAG